VRRELTTVVMGIGVMLAGAAGASAQTQTQAQTPAQIQAQIQAQIDQIRTQIQTHIHERIVTSQDLIEQIHQLVETTLGASMGQQLGRDLGRSTGDMARAMEGMHNMSSASDQSRDYKFEQKDTQTKPLAIGANGTLTLKNVVGDITVKAGGGKDATVEIIRVSKGKTEADAKEGLQKVDADVSVRGEHGSVTTHYPADMHPNYAVSVSYNVTAPAGTSVWVDSITGHIMLTGFNGETKATTVSGRVDVASCTKVGAIHTIAGPITITDSRSDTKLDVAGISATVTLTNIKAPQVSASVISGKIIAHDVQTEGADMDSMSGDIEFSGPVSAKGRYEFTAHSGDVRLGLSGGFDLEAKTFSGTVTTDPAPNLATLVQAGGGTPRQHSLRGEARNGGGTVVASTFSGTVWVGKTLK